MELSFYLLLIIAHLGVLDVIYFHNYKCKLHLRPECQREVFWHVWRHLIYALQFIWIANFRFHGFALVLLGVLYFFDIFIAWADVLEENKSRAAQGGLPRGEYFMHVVLSLLVGAYLINTFQIVWADRNLGDGNRLCAAGSSNDFANLYDRDGRYRTRNFFGGYAKMVKFRRKNYSEKIKQNRCRSDHSVRRRTFMGTLAKSRTSHALGHTFFAH